MRWKAGAIFLLLCSCATNRYGTPRVLDEGESRHVVSTDALLVHRSDFVYDIDGDPVEGWFVSPVALPVYTWRKGLGSGLELGLGLGPFLGTVADLKIELLRSRWLDMAVAPTGGVTLPVPLLGGGLYLGSPLLAGVNVAEPVTLLAQVAPHAAIHTVGNGAAWVSAGGGAQFRLGSSFSLQPMASWNFIAGGEKPFWTAGLAFGWGDPIPMREPEEDWPEDDFRPVVRNPR